MYGKALVVATALLAAAPAFAQSDKSAPGSDHAGPIPYSELAAADAKLNGAGAAGHKARHVRHHVAKAKASAKAGAAASSASSTPPADAATSGR